MSHELTHQTLSRNYTITVTDDAILVSPAEDGGVGGGMGGMRGLVDSEYERFMADVWVGVVLALMVVCCVCCMCSFYLYHKFQQWKITAVDGQPRPYTIESGLSVGDLHSPFDSGEALPNYTLVSGLPSYDEALEQMRQIRQLNSASILKMTEAEGSVEGNQQNIIPSKLSLAEFLQIYKSQRIPS